MRSRHLSIEISPREAGLTPYTVRFTRDESPPLRSMLDEGMWYSHPERDETAIVWAKDAEAIPHVLTYHYPGSWRGLKVMEPQP